MTTVLCAKIVSVPAIELLIQEIAARPDIWMSAGLCKQTLQGLRGS
jgi:hypothetical protein